MTPEHEVEMFRLTPRAQPAVFPHADHFLLFTNPEKPPKPIAEFFDDPMRK